MSKTTNLGLELTTNSSTLFSQWRETINGQLTGTDKSNAQIIDEFAGWVAAEIERLKGIGHFLSLWDATTGLPLTNPPELPFVYHTGDYYIVKNVAQSGGTNYKPDGTSYTGAASTTTESEKIISGATYWYDGATWSLQAGVGSGEGSKFVATWDAATGLAQSEVETPYVYTPGSYFRVVNTTKTYYKHYIHFECEPTGPSAFIWYRISKFDGYMYSTQPTPAKTFTQFVNERNVDYTLNGITASPGGRAVTSGKSNSSGSNYNDKLTYFDNIGNIYPQGVNSTYSFDENAVDVSGTFVDVVMPEKYFWYQTYGKGDSNEDVTVIMLLDESFNSNKSTQTAAKTWAQNNGYYRSSTVSNWYGLSMSDKTFYASTVRYYNGSYSRGNTSVCSYFAPDGSNTIPVAPVRANWGARLFCTMYVTAANWYSRITSTNQNNYKPSGSTYTGSASTTVESEPIRVGNTYYYDGTNWKLEQALPDANKQDKLVSGTNIKTVGGQSLLGAGDLSIPHDSTKQDTLVSGTNIKTINGNSVLGSGDITIESGGSNFVGMWDASTGLPSTTVETGYEYVPGSYYRVSNVAEKGAYSFHFAWTDATIVIPEVTGATKLQPIGEWLRDNGYDDNNIYTNITGHSTLNGTVRGVFSTSNGWFGLKFVGTATEEMSGSGSWENTSVTELPSTNHKPSGSTYTGSASTVEETADIVVGNTYYYDGTTWKLEQASPVIPAMPAIDGTYNLTCTVASGVPTLAWQSLPSAEGGSF